MPRLLSNAGLQALHEVRKQERIPAPEDLPRTLINLEAKRYAAYAAGRQLGHYWRLRT